MSPVEFKAALREQWAILTIDERAAVEALPQLLPADAAARRAFIDTIRAIITATGELNTDAQRRLSEIEQVLETGPFRDASKRRKGQIAAE